MADQKGGEQKLLRFDLKEFLLYKVKGFNIDYFCWLVDVTVSMICSFSDEKLSFVIFSFFIINILKII